MAAVQPHARHIRRHAAHAAHLTPAVAPTGILIATLLSRETITGYPSASVIKRGDDNTLRQTRTAWFANVVSGQPIARGDLVTFLYRPEVFAVLRAQSSTVAARITQQSLNAIVWASLPDPLRPPTPNACPMPGNVVGNNDLAAALAELHRCGLIVVDGPENTMRAALLATPRTMSFAGLGFLRDREGGVGSDHLYWPHNSHLPDASPKNASGVTLGYGYDMKFRDRDTIADDLTGLGVDPSAAASASQGSHRQHADAHAFADQNRNLVSLSADQQLGLMRRVIGSYEATVTRLVQADMAKRLLTCEFDALVSMCFQGALRAPVVQRVVAHDLSAAGTAIVSTTDSQYRSRRLREQALFTRAVYNTGAVT